MANSRSAFQPRPSPVDCGGDLETTSVEVKEDVQCCSVLFFSTCGSKESLEDNYALPLQDIQQKHPPSHRFF